MSTEATYSTHDPSPLGGVGCVIISLVVMKRQSDIKKTALAYNKQSIFVEKRKKNYSQHPVKILFNHSTPEFLQVKYQYNIKQRSDESKEKYYLGDC